MLVVRTSVSRPWCCRPVRVPRPAVAVRIPGWTVCARDTTANQHRIGVSILSPGTNSRGPGAALHVPAAPTGPGTVRHSLCKALQSLQRGLLWGEVEKAVPGLLEVFKGLRIDSSLYILAVRSPPARAQQAASDEIASRLIRASSSGLHFCIFRAP